MSEIFDIDAATAAILQGNDLAEVESLTPDQKVRVFDIGEGNGVVGGDILGDATVKGTGSLLVQGDILGADGSPCRIDVSGDVVITGNVKYAHIRARTIHVGGEAHHIQASAAATIKVAADLHASQLAVGTYDVRKRRTEELKYQLERSRDKRESLDRQVSQDERRLDKSCKTTRIPLNFNVGQLLRHQHNRVQIDLSSFYESIGGHRGEKTKSALTEFFAKGIVGVLARANRKYISDNPAREKVFLQLLKGLRELFILVTERDLVLQQIEVMKDEIDRLVDGLRDQQPTVCVQGAVVPQSEVEFILPRVVRDEMGDLTYSDQSTSVKIQPGAEQGQRALLLRNIDGDETLEELANNAVQTLVFRAEQGTVVWKTLSPNTV